MRTKRRRANLQLAVHARSQVLPSPSWAAVSTGLSPSTLYAASRALPGQDLWAEVEELPGCFASGADMGELRDALSEAVSLYLSEPGHEVRVELDYEPGPEPVTERRLLARTA
jgi:predicted RNase H-like HicB family nuclease